MRRGNVYRVACMFGIENSIAFYGKMLEDYDDFYEQSGSPRHAINCILSAYHMAEWIWGDWLQTDYDTWAALGIKDKASFLSWVDRSEPYFSIVQDIANGSKHFAPKLAKTTPPSVFTQFDTEGKRHERYVLDVKVNETWWLEAIDVVQQIVGFWTKFFKDYRPNTVLPKSRNPIRELPY